MEDFEYYKIVKSALKEYNYRYDDDILQDLVIHLYENINKYNSKKGEFTTFAYTLIRNKYIQIIKERNKTKCINLDSAIIDNIPWLELISENKEIDVYEQTHRQQIFEFIKPYIKEPLQLWLEGYTQIQIAEKLGLKYQTIVSKLIRINLIKIKQICKEKGLIENGKNRK